MHCYEIDCILRPDVGRPSTTTSISHDRQAAGSILHHLDNETRSGLDNSRLDTTREYLQRLLDGDQLTEL